MFSLRSRAFVALAALPKHLKLAGRQPSHTRPLSQLTMGFEDIAKWKEEKQRRADPQYRPTTIFDLVVYTPAHKSNAWNISYAPEPTASRLPSRQRRQFHVTAAQPQTSSKSGNTVIVRNLSPLIKNITEAPAVPVPQPFEADLFSNQPALGEVPNLDILGRLHPAADAPFDFVSEPEPKG